MIAPNAANGAVALAVVDNPSMTCMTPRSTSVGLPSYTNDGTQSIDQDKTREDKNFKRQI